VQRIAGELDRESKTRNKIGWFGDLVAMQPENGYIIQDLKYDDPLYYTLAFNANGINYFTDRPAYTQLFNYRFRPELKSLFTQGDLIIISPPQERSVYLFAFEEYSIFVRQPSEDKNDLRAFKEQNGNLRIYLKQAENGLMLVGKSLPLLYGSALVEKNGTSYSLNGLLINPGPGLIPGNLPVDNIQGLVAIPLRNGVGQIVY
jgi:hypothetical protein